MTASAHPAPRVVRSTGAAALDRLAEAGWDDLLTSRPPADPLRRIAWLEVWLREAAGAVEPRAVIVDRDGAVVAAAALERTRRGGMDIVRNLGQGDAWFQIAPPALDHAALHALLAQIAEEPGDILMLDGCPADPDTVATLTAAIPGVRITPHETWRLVIADPPRSVRKRRKEARRAVRRAAEQGTEMHLEWTTRWADIGPRIGGLLDFHARHFPGEGPNLLAGPGVRRAFTEAAIPALGAEGRARLVEVRSGDGELLAWDLAFRGDGASAVAYAGAFDRSREDLMTLGWISMLHMVERLEQEGVEVVDFGPGPAPYKDLISRSVPLVRAVAPLSLKGRAALAAHRAVGAAKGLRDRRAGVADREAGG
ncbi:MAG: GNAT family N-acetyltransferase [Thermoleophilia bacterium]|nr:GNAT family N-acetyltransferase [Thermoleophilia bacterium]